jgi:hypothetical protein
MASKTMIFAQCLMKMHNFIKKFLDFNTRRADKLKSIPYKSAEEQKYFVSGQKVQMKNDYMESVRQHATICTRGYFKLNLLTN